MKIPFITIVRKPEIQQGTMVNQAFNIPGKPRFSYFTVKTWNGNIEGADVYQIPQPVPVDLSYEVRLFSFRLRELNAFNKKMNKQYAAKQRYLKVNNAYFPTILESIGDESTIQDFEARRYYVQMFEIKLKGYILDGDDFVFVKPAISREILLTEVKTSPTYLPLISQPHKKEARKEYTLDISYEIGAADTVTFSNSTVYTLLSTTFDNIATIVIEVDSVVATPPIKLVGTETIEVTITRDDSTKAAVATLHGVIILQD